LCEVATYEAQAAIRLEAAADPAVTGRYGFAVRTESPTWVLDFGDAIRGVVAEGDVPTAAAKFHNTVAAAVVEVCQRLREQRGLSTIALSGGVWQNDWLLRRVMEELQARRFTVFTNVAVPPNDGGLALGQVAVAAERMKQSCA
jgi:hydrogenase maturation protein HypF